MVEGLQRRDWVLMPTKETLDTMYELAKFNETADLASRKNCFEASFPRFDPNCANELYRNYRKRSTNTTSFHSNF